MQEPVAGSALLRAQIIGFAGTPKGSSEAQASEITSRLENASDALLEIAFDQPVVDALVQALASEDPAKDERIVATILYWLSLAGPHAEAAEPGLTNLVLRLDELRPPSEIEGIQKLHPTLPGRACDALAYVTNKSSGKIGLCARRSGNWPDKPWKGASDKASTDAQDGAVTAGSLCAISNPVASEKVHHLTVIYVTDNVEYTSIWVPNCGVGFTPVTPKIWTEGYRQFRFRLHDGVSLPVLQKFELEIVGRFGPTGSGSSLGFIIDDVLNIRQLE